MKTAHTPIPWRDCGKSGGEQFRIQSDTTPIASVYHSVGTGDTEAEANTELICRAVNCHADLLEACKAAEAAIRVEKTLQAHRGESVAVELGIAHSELLKAISKAEDNT